MQLFFDESGDFDPPRSGRQKFSFVVGILVPEIASSKLKHDFDWLVGQLGSAQFRNGEPKGSLLTLEQRWLLLEILKANEKVMLVPISVNLSASDPALIAGAPEKIRLLIESNLATPSEFMPLRERQNLAKRFGRLSVPVLLRLVSYGIAVLKGIEAIVCRYYCEQFHRDYDPIVVTFDRVVRSGSREELVFVAALPGWISNWSQRMPMRIPPTLDESHPLLARYGKRESGQWRLDLQRMLSGKIGFESSRSTWQVQLADFVANTWSQTLSDYEGRRGCRNLFRDLYRKSALPEETPLGVVAATDRTEVVSAPEQLEVFARIARSQSKILPCS